MIEEIPDNVLFAGFFHRTAAFVMDAIIVSMLFLFLLDGVVYTGQFLGPLFFSGTAAAFNMPDMPVLFGSAVVGIILLVLICWLYSAGSTSSRYGGTFGKMILGMKVVDISGNTISFGRATVRFIAKIFAGLIFFIGFFMIHFSPSNQGLHDRFSGTWVIYGKKAVPAPPHSSLTLVQAPAEKEETKEKE